MWFGWEQPFLWGEGCLTSQKTAAKETTILRDSTVTIVVRTRPRAIPLAIIIMGFLSFLSIGLRLAALRDTEAPLSEKQAKCYICRLFFSSHHYMAWSHSFPHYIGHCWRKYIFAYAFAFDHHWFQDEQNASVDRKWQKLHA